ncbi:hypothetical protein CQB03_26735 [Bacillus paranthracis]|nr:hypothetical protein CQB03_26735 [Bacillus paranthracis]
MVSFQHPLLINPVQIQRGILLILIVLWRYPTSINLTYIFIQNAVFPRSFLLSFIDVIKVGTSNKP